ncbi:MAG: GTP-binding protein [Candidatus Heimdallarchaeota archaeon]|nr:GTP-binding protein [Candidatus Heimdallarchaeota archaeon]
MAYSLKVILLGDPRVGKTSIRVRYLGGTFDKSYIRTFGSDFSIKRIGDAVLQIWDLAGQEEYKSLRQDFYKGANAIILVYDVTDQSSCNRINFWIDEIQRYVNNLIPVALVGNKIDLMEEEYTYCNLDIQPNDK